MRFVKDEARGKDRGRPKEAIQRQSELYRSWIDFLQCGRAGSQVMDHLDVRITVLDYSRPGAPIAQFAFRCLHCGSDKLDEGSPAMVTCGGCGQDLAPAEELRAVLQFFVADEVEFGHPQRYARSDND